MKKSESILIVEDEPIIALMEQQTLQDYGYDVHIAADGASAVETVCGPRQIDLILMDIDLGENSRDGTEVAKEILGLCNIPVIFLSSHSEPEVVSKTEKITSYGYIVKGCNDTILIASIKMAFKLHKSNAYLRTLLEASPEGIWVSNREGRIIDVNQTYCRVSGYTREELIGKYISDIDPGCNYEETADRVRSLKPGQTAKHSAVHTRKNGEPLYVETSVARINPDSETEIVTFCRDRTEERRLSEGIATVEQKFENIIGSMQDAVFTADLEMKINGIYGPWAEHHRMGPKGLVGMSLSEGMKMMGVRFDDSVFFSALRNGYSVFEADIKTSGGAKKYQISLSQIKNNRDEVTGVVGISRDITELIQVREDLKAREMLYSSLLEQVPGAIYQYQYFEDGRSCFPFTSQNIELVYEVTPEDVRTDASMVFSRIHPEDYDGVVESILTSRDRLCDWEHDYRVILPRKGVRWLRGKSTPEKQADGSVLWCGFITDITDLKEIEIELSEQKNLLQMTLQSIGDAVITTDIDGKITDMNKTAEAVTVWSVTDARGRPLSEVFDVTKKIGSTEPDTRKHAEDYSNATILNSKDGGVYRILDTAAPIHDENGLVKGSVVVFRDITERFEKRKQLESTVRQLQSTLIQLSEQSKRLQSVIEATGIGTWEWNVQTGAVRVNERWAEMLGYSLDELDPVSIETWKRLVHPDDFEESNRALSRHFEKKTGFYECEARMKHKDGHWVDVLDRGSALTWTVDGAPEWVYGTHLDITEKKNLKAESERGEKNLRALFENIEMGFVLHRVIRDESGRIIDFIFVEANRTFGRLTGLDPQKIMHRRAGDVISGLEDEYGAWIPRFAEVVETGRTLQLENYSDRLNRWFSVTAYSPLNDMLAILFFDTTENRMLLDEREKSLHTQKILMKELNHRVKNNLLMVKSLIHLKDVEAGEGADLGDIESRVQAIADLHEELQETSRPDRVQLRSYVSRIAENVIDNNPLAVELKLDMADQEVSTRQAVSIGLIINEAVTNAIKHGFKGESDPRLEISSGVDGAEGVIRISNNGRPLPESLDLEHPGSLGLRLVVTLAKQMDGSITIIKKPHPVITIHYRL